MKTKKPAPTETRPPQQEDILQKIIRCCENGRDMAMQDVSLEEIQLLCEREVVARAAALEEPRWIDV